MRVIQDEASKYSGLDLLTFKNSLYQVPLVNAARHFIEYSSVKIFFDVVFKGQKLTYTSKPIAGRSSEVQRVL